MLKPTLDRSTPTWARIAIGVLAGVIAAFGGRAILTQHHVNSPENI